MLPKTPPASWPWAHARTFAAAHSVDLAPYEAPLASWLDLLIAWNARLDLTAARGIEELLSLMLADVIVLAGKLPHAAPGATPLTVVDVGTGAGAPGMGLAILRPDLRVTLCEPLQKRAAFLRTVLGTLRRNDVTLTVARGDALAKNAYDVAISRATLPPPEWLKLAETLMTREKDAEAWVLLARDEEPVAPELSIAAQHLYKWPIDGHERRAVCYRRVGATGATEPGEPDRPTA